MSLRERGMVDCLGGEWYGLQWWGRFARRVCPKLGKLRTFPRFVLPCSVPEVMLRKLQNALQSLLRRLPSFDRSACVDIMLHQDKVCWAKSAMIDVLLALRFPGLKGTGSCRYTSLGCQPDRQNLAYHARLDKICSTLLYKERCPSQMGCRVYD